MPLKDAITPHITRGTKLQTRETRGQTTSKLLPDHQPSKHMQQAIDEEGDDGWTCLCGKLRDVLKWLVVLCTIFPDSHNKDRADLGPGS